MTNRNLAKQSVRNNHVDVCDARAIADVLGIVLQAQATGPGTIVLAGTFARNTSLCSLLRRRFPTVTIERHDI